MQDNDLNIEDFKEIFIKSFGKTVSTQEISDYFRFESEKFKNRFSNENNTQIFKDIIFKKFIEGIEEANTNLSNPFIEREYERSIEIIDLKVQGVDISEIEKPSRYNAKIPLPYLCKKFGFGVHIELEQIEFIYQGFKLFKQQHEENSNNVVLNPTRKKLEKQQTGFYLGYSETQLKALHKALIDDKFLYNQTEEAHFINAFNGERLTNFEKFKWLKDKTNLSLFIGLLNDDNKWKIAETVFENCVSSRNLAKSFGSAQHLNKHILTIKLFRKILGR